MQEPNEFRFVVSAVFTITGRGLVVSGVVEGGSIRSGDQVEIRPGGARAICRGIEMMVFAPDAQVDPRTIGLRLPELSEADVSLGDLVTKPT